jgi:hypothetical protein
MRFMVAGMRVVVRRPIRTSVTVVAAEGIEDPACPGRRHRHSVTRGYYQDGCRCPSTLAARDRKRAWQTAYDVDRGHRSELVARPEPFRDCTGRLRDPHGAFLAESTPVPAEVDSCPADRHAWPGERDRAYTVYGCRCPSTVKAWEARRDRQNQAARRRAQAVRADKNIASFNLSRADRLDAEAIAQGYPMAVRVPIHTQALAVKMMMQAYPPITARQIAWRLDRAKQGRIVHRKSECRACVSGRSGGRDLAGHDRRYEPVSVRHVLRIQAGLELRRRDLASGHKSA